MTSIGTPGLWSLFAAFVIVALALDFFALNRQGAHKVTMKEAGLWSLVWFAVSFAFVGWLWWHLGGAEGDPVASAMLAFEKQNSLNVFSSRFEVVAESTDERGPLGLPILKSRQAMIVPATVTYQVNLASVGKDRMKWDDGSDTLSVQLPPLQTSIPNLDEKNARLFTDGNFVTGGAAQDLARNNSAQAERKASGELEAEGGGPA